MRSFYGQDMREIEQIRRVRTTDGWDLRFVCVNSARGREEAMKEYGYVGEDRYTPLLNRITASDEGALTDELIRANIFNIGVIHHHLVPTALHSWPQASRPVSLTLDAGAIIADFQAAGMHLVLQGHQHVP
jgi:hypothetical protein